jgi:PiT family inorganic phosphate transporter
VGAAKRLSAVRWGVTLQIVWAWIFTIPGAALIGASVYFLIGIGGRVLG